MTKPQFKYNWQLASGYPVAGIEGNGLKVFGTFICGGGSTMGYKLAGCDHLGGVEIDPKIARVYRQNHKPRHLYNMDLRDFLKMEDLPVELYNLDILDGSPPCTSFTLSGNRETDWGKEKTFFEGAQNQRLDDLFFEYIKLAAKLRPKIVIAENVTGLIAGNAKAYVHQITKEFKAAGYDVQIFRLNAATMGVPQKRERIFFICRRKDLALPALRLEFKGLPIFFSQIEKEVKTTIGKPITDAFKVWWEKCPPGRSLAKVHPRGSFFNTYKIWKNQVLPTITTTAAGKLLHWSEPNEISIESLQLCGSYPLDYEFLDVEPKYLIGMSVPPVMMANIAYQIAQQLLIPFK